MCRDLLTVNERRNKLPASPEGTATFNVNSFAPSLVGSDFEINNVGFFNVPSNWEAFKFLAHEEFYVPISFTSISSISIGGYINVANVTGTSYQPELGQIITITQDSGAEYNGTWEVIYISATDEFVISATYIGNVGSGSAGMLPKLSRSDFEINDISNAILRQHLCLDQSQMGESWIRSIFQLFQLKSLFFQCPIFHYIVNQDVA